MNIKPSFYNRLKVLSSEIQLFKNIILWKNKTEKNYPGNKNK